MTGYNTRVAGTTITASAHNTDVRDQVISQFASASARDAVITSPLQGMVAYLKDVHTWTVYTGTAWSTVGPTDGAWTAYTPTFTSVGGTAPNLGNGAVDGAYLRVGRLVHFRARILFGSTTTYGSAGNTWRISIPFTFAAIAPTIIQCAYQAAGTFLHYALTYPVYISASTGYVSLGSLSNTTAAWQNLDYVTINGAYEAAADA
jgi:hypothetical protein